MFLGWDIVSILGYGTIGLGLLLAVLTCLLFRKEREKYTPIYVYLGFCIFLVLTGFWLQISLQAGDLRRETLAGKIMVLQTQYDAVKGDILDMRGATSRERNAAVKKMVIIQEKMEELLGRKQP